MRSAILALATMCLLAAIGRRADAPLERTLFASRAQLHRPHLPATLAVARATVRGDSRLTELVQPAAPEAPAAPRQFVRVAVRELAHRSDRIPPAPASRGPPRG